MKKDNYTFVLLQNQLSCYRYIDNQWKIEPIEREAYFQLNEDQSISWDDFLDKLNQRHNSEDKLRNVSITLIRSNESSADFINGFSKAVVNYNCTNWQVLFVESLLSKKQISSLDIESIRQDLLPKTRLAEYLADSEQASEKNSIASKIQLQNKEKENDNLLKEVQQNKEFEEEKEAELRKSQKINGELLKEIQQNKDLLKEKNIQLRRLQKTNEPLLKEIQQTKELVEEKDTQLRKAWKINESLLKDMEVVQAPDTSYLITYLPLFFSDVWTKITMSDVACFSESQFIPEIPSPYQEPGNDCLHRLKRRFQQLPEIKQSSILECCSDLQHQYKVRRLARHLLEKA